MSYTVKKFEHHFPTEILNRGKKYYDDGAVLSIIEEDENEFVFAVEGAEEYSVEIVFNEKWKMQYSSCSCLFFLDNGLCKHEVAALYYLQEIKSLKIIGSKNKAAKKVGAPKQLHAALQNATKELLTEFITDYSKGSKDFTNQFLLFIKRKEIEANDDYSAFESIISQSIRAAIGRHSYWGSEQLKELSKLLKPIADKLTLCMKEKDYPQSFHLSTAFISALSSMVYHINGGYSSRITNIHIQSFDCFNELVKTEMAIEMKELIREWLWQSAFDKKFHLSDQKLLIQMLENVIHTKKQEEEYIIKLINRIAEHSTNHIKTSAYRHFGFENGNEKIFLDLLINYYRKVNKINEADALILSHAEDYNDYFEYALKYLMNVGEYLKIYNLIESRVKQYPYLRERYNIIQLEAAENLNDVSTIMSLLPELYINTGNVDYYKKYKSIFSSSEWIRESKKFINALKSRRVEPVFLIQVLLEENLHRDALQLLKGKNEFELLAKFASEFYPKNKVEYYPYFIAALNQLFPKHNWMGYGYNQSDYKMIARSLSIIQSSGLADLVAELVNHLTTYHKPKVNLMKLIAPFQKGNGIEKKNTSPKINEENNQIELNLNDCYD